MSDILGSFRRHMSEMIGMIPQPKYGLIANVDPDRHLAKVLLQPDNVLTGWIELGTPLPGWQLLPVPGTQALVMPREGSASNLVVVAYAYSQPDPPPSVPAVIGGPNTPLSAGSAVLSAPGGVAFRLNTDGSALLIGNLNVTGNLIVNGDISDANNTHGTLAQFRADYNAATYPDAQGGNTGTTNRPTA